MAILLTVGIGYMVSLLWYPRAEGPPRAEGNVVIPPTSVRNDEPPRYLFSIYGSYDEPLSRPLAVAEGPNGDIYVADSGNGVVRVFDHKGVAKATLGKKTLGVPSAGEFRYPLGVTVSEDGRVYVSDSMGAHISMFVDGRFVGYFGENDGTKEFSVPAGLSYSRGDLYVNDTGYHQVLVFSGNGKLRTRIGEGRGSRPGEMEFPNFSWARDDGRVIVADSNNNRVQVFEDDGQGSFGEHMIIDPVTLPRGVATDPFGRVHVASALSHRVQVFDSAGTSLFSYGQRGAKDAEFSFPNGVYIGSDRIYIADRENHRVQVWIF